MAAFVALALLGCNGAFTASVATSPPTPASTPVDKAVWNMQGEYCSYARENYEGELEQLRPLFARTRVDEEIVHIASVGLERDLQLLRDRAPHHFELQFDRAIHSLAKVFEVIQTHHYKLTDSVRHRAYSALSNGEKAGNSAVARFTDGVCGLPVQPFPTALFDSNVQSLVIPCTRVSHLTESLATDPGPVRSAAPISLDAAWAGNSSELLTRLGARSKMIEDRGVIDLTLPGGDNPALLELAQKTGYTGAVLRKWLLPSGQTLNHTVYGFETRTGAEAFERTLLREICRYATASWTAHLRFPNGGISTGVGLQLRKQIPGLFEQVSFLRGPYRHVISLSFQTPPRRHDAIVKFARLAARS